MSEEYKGKLTSHKFIYCTNFNLCGDFVSKIRMKPRSENDAETLVDTFLHIPFHHSTIYASDTFEV